MLNVPSSVADAISFAEQLRITIDSVINEDHRLVDINATLMDYIIQFDLWAKGAVGFKSWSAEYNKLRLEVESHANRYVNEDIRRRLLESELRQRLDFIVILESRLREIDFLERVITM